MIEFNCKRLNIYPFSLTIFKVQLNGKNTQTDRLMKNALPYAIDLRSSTCVVRRAMFANNFTFFT